MTEPRCSVIIPVHNKALLTKQCLESILESPPKTSYELIVVDDASTDSTQEMLETFGSAVRVVGLTDNAGFATACNSGAAASAADFLVFLNNDTIALDGWLDALARYADAHPRAAVVGSKLLFPDGTVQHAGVVFNFAGEPLHIYAGCAPDHPAVNTSRPFQVVTGACLLVRRADFRTVGGFDIDYKNDLEDVDLCLRLGARGHQIHYCHESVLIHLESASRGRTVGPGRSARTYRERWGDRVPQDELDYYLEDGFLDVMRTRPDKVALSRNRRDDADVLQARSRQLGELLREVIRIRTHDATNPLAGHTASRGLRRRSATRIRAVRDELAGPLPGFQPIEAESALPPSGDSSPNRPEPQSREIQYDQLLGDVRAAIIASTAPGATVLVVGKGDDRLLQISDRSGWHFPRAADGRYAGYHPSDSQEAISHLERLRRHGAGYIVFPRTSLWWLDYYAELNHHLDLHYKLLHSGDDCVIFDLQDMGPTTIDGPVEIVDIGGSDSILNGWGEGELMSHNSVEPRLDDELVEQIRQVVAALLPPTACVLVAAQGDDRLVDLPGHRTQHFPSAGAGFVLDRNADAEAVIAHLEESRASGAEFLLIPKNALQVVEDDSVLEDYLHARYSTIFYDDSSCLVFELADRPVAPLVRTLIPEGAWVAVAAHHRRALAGLDEGRTVPIPLLEDDSELLVTVDAHASARGGFLVLPCAVFGWLADHQEFLGGLRDRYRLVTNQKHVCEIYDLSPASRARPPTIREPIAEVSR